MHRTMKYVGLQHVSRELVRRSRTNEISREFAIKVLNILTAHLRLSSRSTNSSPSFGVSNPSRQILRCRSIRVPSFSGWTQACLCICSGMTSYSTCRTYYRFLFVLRTVGPRLAVNLVVCCALFKIWRAQRRTQQTAGDAFGTVARFEKQFVFSRIDRL